MSIFKKISILSLVLNLNIAPLNNFVYSIEQENGDDEPTMDTGEVIFKQIDEDDELYDKYDSQEDNNNQNSDGDIVFRRLEDDENPDDENYQDFNDGKDYQITESDETAIEEISSGMIRVIVSADNFSIIEEYEGLNKESEKEPESEPTSVSEDEATVHKNDEKIDTGKIEKNSEDISSEGTPESIKNENNEELTENVVSFMDAEDNNKENNEEKSSVVSFMDSSEENNPTQENEKNNTNDEIFIREIKDENDEEISDNNTDNIIENKNLDEESVNNEEDNSEELSSKETDSQVLISEYNGMYLLQYPSIEKANAAIEYYNTYANFAVLDMVVFINQDEETTPEEEIISETEMDEESNPFKELETAVDENLESIGSVVSYKKKIAVIDTGNNYSEIPTVSMLGDSGSDLNGHGTKMIDYIQAENPDVDIIAIKALGDDGKGDISAVYAGIMYAIEAGVDVINMSFNAFSTSENAVLKDAVLKANSAGIEVVVSAGNNGIDAKYFTPSGIDEAIVIGSAIQNEDTVTKQSFSNYGETVDYYVLSDSTSEGAARFSGMLSNSGFDEINANINNEKVFVFDNSYTVSIDNKTDIADSEIIDSSEPVEPDIDDINTSGEFETNTLTRTWDFAFNGSSGSTNEGKDGSIQTWTAPYHAIYKLEVYGAQGGWAGTGSNTNNGYGGYSSGNSSLTTGTNLYIAVGGIGGEGDDGTYGNGGWNGGAVGGGRSALASRAAGGGGGGATSITTTNRGTLENFNSYKNEVVIVAGGGGGYCSKDSKNGGKGGGTTGSNGSGGQTIAGGTQTGPGTSGDTGRQGSFGKGGVAKDKKSGITSFYAGSGGGGGGWYGGNADSTDAKTPSSGGGGSGYIQTASTLSSLGITPAVPLISGTTSTTQGGATQKGHGSAKISFVSLVSGNFVIFNLNGYSLPEFEGNETYVEQGDSIELPNIHRDFYYFLGWSTSTSAANIVSSPYIPTATASTVTLYAIWQKIPDTYLASGSVVNQKLKSLENSTATVDSIDITTQSFERVYNPPINETTVDISKNQDESVLAWESGGVIKWYTDAEFVNMDTDSSKMFYNFQELSSIDLTGFKSASVSNMKGMFSNCISLNSITLSTTFNFSGNSISSVENKALLPEVPNISPYDGKWYLGSRTYTSQQMRDNNPQVSYSGTYAWHELSNLTKTTYGCTANYQTFTASQNGKYQLEVYGAQGGFSGTDGAVGDSINTTDYQKGGYSKGRITLNANQTLYVSVGCKGGNGQGKKNDTTIAGAGGWNGGGNGGQPVKDAFYTTYPGGGGGGATSIQTSLRGDGQLKNYSNNRGDVLIVAGGGGGLIYAYTKSLGSLVVYDIIYGGSGGGLEGNSEDGRDLYNIASDPLPPLPAGTQTSGYAFGQGQSAADKTTDDTIIPGQEMGNSGAGGGWYGGYASQVTTASNTNTNYSVGTGGSGYLNPSLSKASTVIGRKTGDGQAIITELASGYHIQFNAGDGQFSDSTSQKVIEITNSGSGYAIDPASVGTPTSTSGSFAGWYTDPVLGTEVNLASIDETYDERVLYAVYRNESPSSATAPTAKTLTYNDSSQVLANAATNVLGGTVQYALGTNGTTEPTSGWSTSVPTATNVGTYYVWWKIVADTGYTNKEPAYIGTASTIVQREVTITDPTAVSGTLTYNGSAKTLANPGSCTAGGTMYYYVSTSSTAPAFSISTWKTTIDQKTDAGTYYIHYYCYVSDTTNNKSSTASGAKAINTAYSISKAISKATPTLTLSATSGTLTYPNTGTFTITSNPSGGTLSVASGTTSVATAAISGTTVTLTPAIVSSDGDTSVITITSAATGNYNATTATYTATVNRGTITLTPTVLNGTYTGSKQYAKIKSNVAGVTIVSGTSTSYGNTITTDATANTNYNLLPGYTNYQASTTIYYKATKAGYKDATGSTTATIAKASSTATAPTSKSSTYSGSAQALANAAINVVGGTVQYAKGTNGTTAPISGWDTSIPTETNAGTYYVWWKIVGDNNHSDKVASYIGSTSVISKATNQIAVTTTQSGSVPFSSNAQSKSFTAATNAQGEVTYSISSQKQGTTTVNYFTIPTSSTASFNVAANTPAGTYEIVISANAAGNGNYESGAKSITYTLTINKVTPTLTLSATSGTLTYPNTGTFTVTSNPSGGTLSVAFGTTSVATASISGTTVTITPAAVASDGGTSVITVTSAANGSYNAATATYTVTVNRGTLGAVTATNKTYEYDGTAKYLDAVTCATSGTTIAYGTTSGTYNKSSITDSILGQTSVGTKMIYYNVTKDGYIPKAGSYTLTVQDTTSPSPSITSTNNVANSQTITLSATDLVGVTSYYWGTKSNPASSDYTTVTSATNWSTTKTVNASGTYYLFVKDNAGNVNSVNKTFYSTTFSVTNGSTSISSVITMSGNSFNTPSITPNTGYSSSGKWSYGTSSTVNAGSSYTPSANNTLTAVCTANTNTAYTVYHYQKDIGSTSYTLKDTDNLTGTSDASLTLANLKKTTYAGFTYDAGYLTGGATRPTSGAITTTTIAPDGTRKIYLYYTRNTHKVTLTAGTGIASVAGANNSVEFGASVSINATLSEGYNWSKWTNSSGGSQVSTTQNLTFTMPDNDVAYTANGVLKTYIVSYDANGGSGAPSNQTKTHGTDLTLSSTKPTKADTTSSWTVNFALGDHGTSTGATNNKLTPTATTKHTFSNWASSSDSATYNAGATYSVNAATTMTANYTSNTTSAAITLPTPTGATGYEFDGWYNGSTKAGNAGASYTPSANNQTLTAHWKTITYTISYNLNKGTGSTTPSHNNPKASYDVESATFTLVNPTRTGYTFAGWTGSNGTTAQTSVSVPTGTTENLSYTANWTPKSITYNVVYKSSSDKSLGTATIAKNFDTTNTVTAPDKAGYTTPASQSVAWDSETAKTITFTYTPITYDISYTNNGGAHSNPTSYNVESADITLADATKTGYTFTGWTGNGTTTPTKSLKLVSGSTGNKTYTANFTANTTTPYTVYHYQKNLGSTAYTLIDTDNLTGTSDASLTLANLKKTTYTGFTYDAGYLTGGTTRPSSGATTTTTIAPDGTRKIYLYYTRNTHKVILTAGTGIASVTGANNSVEFGASVSINATVSEGYIWSEWTNTSGGSQVSTTKNYTFTMPDNDVSYTANTVLKTYTVSYDANGGSGAPSSQTKTHGTDLTLSSTKPTKISTSVSWSTNFEVGDHGTSTGATNNTISSTATTTYTFTNWSSSADSQTYNAGGTYSHEASTVMTANYSSSTSGASITLPTPTAETGFHFTGWYNSSTKIGGAGESWTPINNNQTLTAHWEANSYTVVYNKNGGSGSMSNSEFTYNVSGNLTANGFTAPSGYSFGGWADSVAHATSGTVYRVNSAAHGNMTTTNGATVNLYAIWKRNITFYSGNNKATATTVIQYYDGSNSIGANITTPSSSTCVDITGWTELGWRDDTTAGTKEIDFNISITPTSTSYYAVYSRDVTFYSGVNKEHSETQSQYYNTDGKYSVVTPTPVSISIGEGWEQRGWVITTEAKEGDTIAGETDTHNSSKYNAVYRRQLSINYSNNTRTRSVPPTTTEYQYYNTDSGVSTPEFTLAENTFEKTGYTFSKWDLGPEGSIYNDWTPEVNDTTLTKTANAEWNAITYIVHYNANGGSGTTMADSTFAYDSDETLTANSYSAPTDIGDNWSFGGWALSVADANSGAVARTDRTTHDNLSSTQDDEVTLYAIWKRTITFKSGSKQATSTQATEYRNVTASSSAVVIPAGTASLTGWTFSGWREDTNADTAVYNATGAISPTATTLYAVYTRTATFYSGINKATTATATQYRNTGTATAEVWSVTIPNAPTAITSWTIQGWRTDTTADNKVFDPTGTITAEVGSDFYAVYNRNLTLSYNGNGNTGGSAPSNGTFTQKYNADSAITSPSFTLANNTFTKTNYVFNNWDLGAPGSVYTAWNPAVNDTTVTKTATAQWLRQNNVSVVCQVSGNMGSKDKRFTYTTSFVNTDIPYANQTINYTLNGSAQTLTLNGSSEGTIELSSNDIAIFQNIREGTVFTITQEDYATDGYSVNHLTASETLTNSDYSVTFTNTNVTAVPTGVNGHNPFATAIIFLTGILGVIYIVIKRTLSKKES